MIWIALMAAVAAPQAQKADEVVARMQAVYERTRAFQAEFRQVLTSTVYGRKQTFDGTVRLKKPGKMRWDYARPEKKLFVSDGKVLWVYDAEDEQAFRQPLTESQLPAAITFLLGKGKLDREFDASLVQETSGYGDPGDPIIKLVPKQGTARLKEMVLDIDPATFQVKQTFVRDVQGNLNQIQFFHVELNPRLADSLFEWSPPAGTRIVRSGL